MQSAPLVTRLTSAALVVLALVSVASSAQAQRATVGVRAGLSVPFGEMVQGEAMADDLLGAVPVQLDLLYHAVPRVQVGAYVSYGPMLLREGDSDADFRQLRVGLQGLILLDAPTRSHGWLGLFVGMDQLGASASDNDKSIRSVVRGTEVGLQAGYAFRVTPTVHLGPFISASVARYSSAFVEASANGQQESKSMDIKDDELAFHQWLSFGLQGAFSL